MSDPCQIIQALTSILQEKSPMASSPTAVPRFSVIVSCKACYHCACVNLFFAQSSTGHLRPSTAGVSGVRRSLVCL